MENPSLGSGNDMFIIIVVSAVAVGRGPTTALLHRGIISMLHEIFTLHYDEIPFKKVVIHQCTK